MSRLAERREERAYLLLLDGQQRQRVRTKLKIRATFSVIVVERFHSRRAEVRKKAGLLKAEQASRLHEKLIEMDVGLLGVESSEGIEDDISALIGFC